MEPTKHNRKPRRDDFVYPDATEATDATEAQPLFTVERREVVGTVYAGGGDDHPVVAGYRIAAEAMTGEPVVLRQRFEFTLDGITYSAASKPATDDSEATGE